MSYVEKNLLPGETVLYETRLHWIVLFWPAVIAICVGVLALGLLTGGIANHGEKSANSGGMVGVSLILLLVSASALAWGFLRRNATEMSVTNRRVLIKTGLLSRKSLEVILSKIESIGVDESVAGRLLGYGTVIVRGTGGTPEPFNQIAHPTEFRRQVQQQIGSS